MVSLVISSAEITSREFVEANRPMGTDEERETVIVDAVLKRHFKQWDQLNTSTADECIRQRRSELAQLGGLSDNPQSDFGLYERIEFQDRQINTWSTDNAYTNF